MQLFSSAFDMLGKALDLLSVAFLDKLLADAFWDSERGMPFFRSVHGSVLRLRYHGHFAFRSTAEFYADVVWLCDCRSHQSGPRRLPGPTGRDGLFAKRSGRRSMSRDFAFCLEAKRRRNALINRFIRRPFPT
jgi:hypothetical protein